MTDDKQKLRPGDKLLKPRTVADRLGITVREVYNLIAAGYFDVHCPNGPGRRPVRIFESSVERYMLAYKVPADAISEVIKP